MAYRSASQPLLLAASLVLLSACGGGGGGGPVPHPSSFSVTGLGTITGTAVTLGAGATYTIGASENGATPGPLTVTLDTAAVGNVSGVTLVTGLANASGHLTVSDSKHGLSVTLTVTVLTTHPATVGNSVTLAGSIVHTITRPQPAPVSPQPPSTTTTSVSDTITVPSITASFGGATGLIDVHSVEADTSPLQNITTTSDSYAQFAVKSGAHVYYDIGSTSTDTNGVSDATTYGTGIFELDTLPDKNGAAWTNTAQSTFSETEPDTTTISRTTNADGTYTETDNYLGVDPGTTTTNADLSAAISGFAGAGVNVTFGAPSGGKIAVLVVTSGSGSQTLLQTTIGDWYPTTTIASDAFAKATTQTIPAACKAAASAGTTATAVAETRTHLDTALGTYEKRTSTLFYAPGFGLVCAQLADTIDTYYDYTGQSPQLQIPGLNFAVGSSPIQIDTIAENVGFQSGTVSGSDHGRAPLALAPADALRAIVPSFDRTVQTLYRARREAQQRFVAAHRSTLLKEFPR